jgi:hypothetical protein
VAQPPGSLSKLVITTEHGTVLVPDDFPHRESHDGPWHACIRGTIFSPPELICLFEPPSMSGNARMTNIEWTNLNWNPVVGCSIISP